MYRKFYRLPLPVEKILFVLLGAVPGALLRWHINSDLFSNILGSALLGFIVGAQLNDGLKLFLAIGFCGSFTTFSGWILSFFELMNNGFLIQAITAFFLPLVGGLFSLGIGFVIGKKIWQTFIP